MQFDKGQTGSFKAHHSRSAAWPRYGASHRLPLEQRTPLCAIPCFYFRPPNAASILGTIDAAKFRSCMTFFVNVETDQSDPLSSPTTGLNERQLLGSCLTSSNDYFVSGCCRKPLPRLNRQVTTHLQQNLPVRTRQHCRQCLMCTATLRSVLQLQNFTFKGQKAE